MKKLFAFLVALVFVPAISNAQLYVTGGVSAFGGDALKNAGSGSQQQQAQAAAEISAGFNAGVKYKYKLPIPLFGINAVGHFNYATGKSQLNSLPNITLPPGVTLPETNITALMYGVGVEVIPIGFLPIIDPYISLDYTLNSVKQKRDAFTQGSITLPGFDESTSGSGLGIGVGTGIKLPVIPIVFDVEVKYRMLGKNQNVLLANVGAGLSF
ncbi:MAG: outer membrane beta-barrel protein [Chloroherpetonaceae bacterium]